MDSPILPWKNKVFGPLFILVVSMYPYSPHSEGLNFTWLTWDPGVIWSLQYQSSGPHHRPRLFPWNPPLLSPPTSLGGDTTSMSLDSTPSSLLLRRLLCLYCIYLRPCVTVDDGTGPYDSLESNLLSDLGPVSPQRTSGSSRRYVTVRRTRRGVSVSTTSQRM